MPLQKVANTDIQTATTFVFSNTLFGLGSAGAPSLAFSGDTNTGIFSPGADTIAFAEGGVESMRIDSSGNMGIGTSSPVAFNEQKHLTVNYTGSGTQVSGYNLSVNDTKYVSLITYPTNSEGLRITTHTALPMTFQTNGTERMRLDSSGNLGLGVTPSTWTNFKAFEIAGGAFAGISQNQVILVNNGYYNTVFKYKTTAAAGYYQIAGAAHTWGIAASGSADTNIAFTSAMTLDASGNLGIGTTSPNTKLHIVGTTSNGAVSPIFQGTQAGTGAGTGTSIRLGYSIATAGYSEIIGAYANPGTYLTFATAPNNSTNATERMRITSGGIALIGTTSASGSNLLQVNSDALINGLTIGIGGGSQSNSTVLGYQANNGVNTNGGVVAVGYQAINVGTATALTTAVGYQSLFSTTTGTQNTAVGAQSLYSNTTASNNTAVGYQAGYNNVTGTQNVYIGSLCAVASTGSYNVIIGYGAGYNATSGSYNTAVGQSALYNASGSYNTAIGQNALNANTTASNNTAVGYQALYANTTGANNTAVGYRALDANTTGTQNNAFGQDALGANTTGNYNSAFGDACLTSNTTGQRNVAMGTNTMANNSSGEYNTAIGQNALNQNTVGNYRTAIGYNAGASATSNFGFVAIGADALVVNTTGHGNVAIGGYSNYTGVGGALRNNTTGNENTAVGTGALSTNTTGSRNTGCGEESLNKNTTGEFNTGCGYGALQNQTTPNGNTALGYQAGATVSTGYSSVFIGYQAVAQNAVTGYENVAVGYQSLFSLNTGNHNVCVGFQAGSTITTGPGNVMLGKNAQPSAGTGNDQTCIGANLTGKGNSTAFIGGACYQGNNSANWSTTSDRRLKKNIVNNNIGLEKIMNIQIRNFEYRLPEEVDSELQPTDAINKPGVQLGVIAQELAEILPECVKTESTGVMSVDSDNLTWYLINAVKQLNAKVEALEAQLNK